MKKLLALAVGLAILGTAAVAMSQVRAVKPFEPVKVDVYKFDPARFTNAYFYVTWDFSVSCSKTADKPTWVSSGWVWADNNWYSVKFFWTTDEWVKFIDYVDTYWNDATANKSPWIGWAWRKNAYVFDARAYDVSWNRSPVIGGAHEHWFK